GRLLGRRAGPGRRRDRHDLASRQGDHRGAVTNAAVQTERREEEARGARRVVAAVRLAQAAVVASGANGRGRNAAGLHVAGRRAAVSAVFHEVLPVVDEVLADWARAARDAINGATGQVGVAPAQDAVAVVGAAGVHDAEHVLPRGEAVGAADGVGGAA